MKTYYTAFILCLTTILGMAQGYDFGIVHISNYDFKVIAIPNFDSAGNTDVSDIGFTLMLPAGTADIVNESGLLGGRVWTIQEFDAAFLTGQGLGDGTRDAFQFNLPAGQTIFSHTNGQQIDLVGFQVSNNPISGIMSILLNSDPIATGAGGVLDSFYNSNIDATTTQNYFLGLAPGLEDFMFSTLNIDDVILNNGISVYPNPASKYINVNSSFELDRILMFNMLGERVLETHLTEQLNVRALSAGMYFLNLYTKDGKMTVKNIIIER